MNVSTQLSSGEPAARPGLTDLVAGQESRDPQNDISAAITSNPALENMRKACEGARWVDVGPFYDHVKKYGFSLLTPDAIEAVRTAAQPFGGRVVSVFSGLGYAEAQLVANGLDVIGFDKTVHPERWLLDIHEVNLGIDPSGLNYSRFADRVLFMATPDRGEGGISFAATEVQRFREAGGSVVAVVSESRGHRHTFGSDEELYRTLAEGVCSVTVDLPKWPTLVTLSVMRRTISTFEPVLKIYKFE